MYHISATFMEATRLSRVKTQFTIKIGLRKCHDLRHDKSESIIKIGLWKCHDLRHDKSESIIKIGLRRYGFLADMDFSPMANCFGKR